MFNKVYQLWYQFLKAFPTSAHKYLRSLRATAWRQRFDIWSQAITSEFIPITSIDSLTEPLKQHRLPRHIRSAWRDDLKVSDSSPSIEDMREDCRTRQPLLM